MTDTQFAFRTLRVSANESRKILNSLLTMPEFPSFIRSLSSISYEFQDKQISSLKKLENEIGTARLKTALDWDKILDPIYTGAEPSKLELQDVFLLLFGVRILLSTPHKRACFFRESAFEVYRRTCHRQPLLYTLVLKKDQKSSSSLFLPFILFSLSHNPLSYVHFPLNSPKAAFLCPLQARPPLPINQLLPNTTPIQSHQQQQTPARYRPSSSFSP